MIFWALPVRLPKCSVFFNLLFVFFMCRISVLLVSLLRYIYTSLHNCNSEYFLSNKMSNFVSFQSREVWHDTMIPKICYHSLMSQKCRSLGDYDLFFCQNSCKQKDFWVHSKVPSLKKPTQRIGKGLAQYMKLGFRV